MTTELRTGRNSANIAKTVKEKFINPNNLEPGPRLMGGRSGEEELNRGCRKEEQFVERDPLSSAKARCEPYSVLSRRRPRSARSPRNPRDSESFDTIGDTAGFFRT